MTNTEKNSRSRFSDRQRIDFGPVMKMIGAVVLLIAVPFFILSLVNKQRSAMIHDTYYREGTDYISKNRVGLINVFAAMRSTKCLEFSPCQVLEQEELMNLLSHDLKDFSSTMFIGHDANGKEIALQMSGNADVWATIFFGNPSMFGSNAPSPLVYIPEMFDGKIDKAPWSDYTYVFPGKEVLIPVTDNVGNVIGIMVRGVIE